MSRLVEYAKQFGRFQRNARLYLLNTVFSGVTVGIILVLYNLYLVTLGYDTAFIGLLLFVGTLGGGLAIFPAGLCIDRFGGKRCMIWSSVLISLAGAGQMLLRTPIPLLISVFVVGIGGAFLLVVNAPYLTTNSTPEERPHLFSLNIVLALGTAVLGELLGGMLPLWLRGMHVLMQPLPPAFSWMLASAPLARSYQLALLLAGIIAAPSFIPLFLLSDDRPALRTDDRVSARRSVPSIEGLHRTAQNCYQRYPLRKLVRSAFVAVLMTWILVYLGAGLFIPYFSIYFVHRLGASSGLFGVIDGSANALNALLTLFAPWLARRLGKVMMIIWTRLASLPLLLAIALSGSLPLAALLYPLRQGMMDMSLGIFQVFSMEVVAPSRRGLANSAYQGGYQAAYAIGSLCGGVLIVRLGYSSVFLVASVLYLLAILLLLARFGPSRHDAEKQGLDEREEVTSS